MQELRLIVTHFRMKGELEKILKQFKNKANYTE